MGKHKEKQTEYETFLRNTDSVEADCGSEYYESMMLLMIMGLIVITNLPAVNCCQDSSLKLVLKA